MKIGAPFWISYTRGSFSVIFDEIRFDESFAVSSEQTFSRPTQLWDSATDAPSQHQQLEEKFNSRLYFMALVEKGVGPIVLCNQAFCGNVSSARVR